MGEAKAESKLGNFEEEDLGGCTGGKYNKRADEEEVGDDRDDDGDEDVFDDDDDNMNLDSAKLTGLIYRGV